MFQYANRSCLINGSRDSWKLCLNFCSRKWLSPTCNLVSSIIPWGLCTLKGALSGLRQFVATESPLKMIKNAFYFTLKSLFVLEILTLLFWLCGHIEKRFDWKDKVNFKIYDVIIWSINNCNTHIENISTSISRT